MRYWLWILSFLLVSGCYEKTTCCLRDGGCPEEDACDAGGDADDGARDADDSEDADE